VTRQNMVEKIYNQVSLNGRGSGWLSILIHEVTGSVSSLLRCTDEQIKQVYERVYNELPRKPKGRKPKNQGDTKNG
jgi:hypothetical protein